MGFWDSFGRSIGGMFGLSGVLGQSQAQKLQSQLSAAKDKMGQIFQSGVVQNEKDLTKMADQMLALTLSEQRLSSVAAKQLQDIEQHDASMANLKILISVTMILIVFIYLMFSKKCC